MADIAVSTSVLAGSDAVLRVGTAGATITAGQWVYKDSSDGKYKLADANGASAPLADVVGMALNGAVSGQPLTIVEYGTVTAYSGVKAGQAYVLSNTAGSMCLESDLTEDASRLTVVAVGQSTTQIKVGIIASGVVVNLA